VYASDCQQIGSMCINNVCNLNYLPGARCHHDYECASNSCLDHKCTGLAEGAYCERFPNPCDPPLSCGPSNTCIQPQQEGAACFNDNDCVQTLECFSGTCRKYLEKGDVCNFTFSNNLCGGATTCYPNDTTKTYGKCKTIYSGEIGTPCVSAENCAEGLQCGPDGCTQGIRYDSGSKVYCTKDSDCQEFELCGCNGYGAQQCYVPQIYFGNPDGIKKAEKHYIECMTQCLRTDYECITSNCKKEYCSLMEINFSQEGQTGHSRCYNQYILQNYYGNFVGFSGYFICDLTLNTNPY